MTSAKNKISSMKTVRTFLKVGTCSETLLRVLNHAFDQPLKQEEKAVAPLAGGIMRHGYQCGMIWGASLAAGAQAFRLYGSGFQAESRAIIAAQRTVESFRSSNNAIDCYDITEMDRSSSTIQMMTYFLLKGGTIGCFRMAAKYAPLAFSGINRALSEEHIETPTPPPVSCSAMLAKKMRVSEKQVVMAAGFAGGIGLCGGACGALGAAIWIMALNKGKQPDGKMGYDDPESLAVIEKFLKCNDYKFECSEIVGRKFENIADHADYLRDGGCSEIIESLAVAALSD